MNGKGLQQDDQIISLKSTLKEFSDLTAKLNSVTEVGRKSLSIKKESISQKGREEVRQFLWDKMDRAGGAGTYQDAHKLVRLYHQTYEQFKRVIESRESTHRYITEKALGLVNLGPDLSHQFLEYCTYPDDPKSDMQDLIFEGHFYGDTVKGKKGNFMENVFPALVVFLSVMKKATHGLDEDIHEDALKNFVKNYGASSSSGKKGFYLGVAAHYLQDLTAPHHVGNYPAVPYVDHYFFEKYANKYIYKNPKFKITSAEYDNFKASLNKNNSSDPKAYAKEIYERAKKFIPYIETDLHKESAGTEGYTLMVDSAIDEYNKNLVTGNDQWREAVDKAIPLAVYATAYLFETAP